MLFPVKQCQVWWECLHVNWFRQECSAVQPLQESSDLLVQPLKSCLQRTWKENAQKANEGREAKKALSYLTPRFQHGHWSNMTQHPLYMRFQSPPDKATLISTTPQLSTSVVVTDTVAFSSFSSEKKKQQQLRRSTSLHVTSSNKTTMKPYVHSWNLQLHKKIQATYFQNILAWAM